LGVEHPEGVGHELLVAVGIGILGAIRAPVSAPVEDQDAEVASEVRDLPLPQP